MTSKPDKWSAGKADARHAYRRVTGKSECAGINRHVVGDERALQERRQRLHPGLESCRRDREVSLEA